MTVRLLGTICLAGCVLTSALYAESSPLFRVVTYNVRYANPRDGLDVWPNRVDTVVDFLKQQDIAGLQEVTASQLDDLGRMLEGFQWYGVGRDDGKRGGEHAVIFYRPDRFAAIQQGTFWLSESPQQIGVAGWDASLPRTCTWMVLRDKASERSFLVANTHFDHRGTTARLESARLVVRQLEKLAGDLPVIVLGDFNCDSDSEPYRELIKSAFLTDARGARETEPMGPNSTWNGFNSIVPGRVIDHVFVGSGLHVKAMLVADPRTPAGRFASDHLPVCVSIAMNLPEPKNESDEASNQS